MTITTETSTQLRAVDADDNTVFDLDLVQGMWTAEQYLAWSDHSMRLVEFTDGYLEFLPMPTRRHQAISRLLFLVLMALLEPRGGTVFYAPLRIQLRPGKYREPDILLLLNKDDPRNQERFWLGADLVIEIVSPADPARDITVKRADYAEIGIPEYWIIEPEAWTITVLVLDGEAYRDGGVFRRGELARSLLLPDFSVAVDTVMAAN